MDSDVEWYLDNSHSPLTYKATLTSLCQLLRDCGEVELRGRVPNGEVFELNDIGVVARVLSMGYSPIEMVDACHLTQMVNGLDREYVPVRKLKAFSSPTDVPVFMRDFWDNMRYFFGE